MYTRSYGNRGARPHLPPDYGGTALIAQSAAEQSYRAGGAEQRTDAIAEPTGRTRIARRAEKSGTENDIGRAHPIVNEPIIRRPARYEEARDEDRDYIGRAPFASQAGAADPLTSQDTEKLYSYSALPASTEKEPPFYKKLFDPDKLKSDDLLLLGLIVLIFNDSSRDDGEKDMAREALLILAALYLSGL